MACSLRDTHTIDTNTHEMGSNRNLDSITALRPPKVEENELWVIKLES